MRTQNSLALYAAPYMAALGLIAVVLASAPAHSLSIISANSGLDQGNGCGAADCFFSNIFTLDASAPVSGTFDLSGGTLTFSIDLAAASFSGSDGAVTGVNFANVNYSGAVAVTPGLPGFVTFLDQPASVSGTLTPVGAGSAVAFSAASTNLTGNCQTVGSSITCGLNFGAGIGFPIGVNGNTRYFNHRVDVVALIPEPSTALLLGAGLALLGARRRSA